VKDIKLVLSGSGTKFPVFAGALKRLEEEGCRVVEVIGTSGGSIIAAAIASGMNADQIIDLCKKIMPRLASLVDFSMFRPLTDHGFVGGKKISQELSKHFVKTLGQTKIPLHITATNFDNESLEIFSTTTHPTLEVYRACRASISIPLYFVPEVINGDLYVDGGIKANFAIDYFGNNADVVGLYFKDKPGRKPRPRGIKGLVQFIVRIINILINSKTEDDIEDAKNTNFISLYSDVDGLDFSFTDKQVTQMIKEGYETVDKWIKANPDRLKVI
jgi:NTE family protein